MKIYKFTFHTAEHGVLPVYAATLKGVERTKKRLSEHYRDDQYFELHETTELYFENNRIGIVRLLNAETSI